MSSTGSFSDLGLPAEICATLTKIGYTQPSEIQAQAIPILLRENVDMLALAQTGTGKTAAFGLPLLSLIAGKSPTTYALILCPTRELCLQISENLNAYAQELPQLRILAVYGGVPISKQLSALRKPVQIIVATPGRLQDLLEKRAIDLSQVKYAVLDEADEMLNMGFRDEIIDILQLLPQEKSVWLFSASMQDSIRQLMRKIMTRKPVEIQVAPANSANRNIQHRYFLTNVRNKYEALERLLLCAEDLHAVIFCRTKNDTQNLAYKLKTRGFEVDYLNGDMAQGERELIMTKYKNHLINILVATDVAARGIDVRDVTHVLNYDLPDDYEVYTHRSGRTARAGKLGFCYSILSPAETYKIPRIEAMIRDKIQLESIPNIQKVQQAILAMARKKMEQMHQNPVAHLQNLLQKETLPYDLSTLQLLLFQTLIGEKLASLNQGKDDLNVEFKASRKDRFKEKDATNSKKNRQYGKNKGAKLHWLSINIGRQDGFKTKGAFIAWLLRNVPSVSKGLLGRISMEDRRTSFELPEDLLGQVRNHLINCNYRGRRLRVS